MKMTQENYTGILYKHGPSCASNTFYLFDLDADQLRMSEESKADFEAVERYDNLSVKDISKIFVEVGKYGMGPQRPLVKKIHEILKDRNDVRITSIPAS